MGTNWAPLALMGICFVLGIVNLIFAVHFVADNSRLLRWYGRVAGLGVGLFSGTVAYASTIPTLPEQTYSLLPLLLVLGVVAFLCLLFLTYGKQYWVGAYSAFVRRCEGNLVAMQIAQKD